MPQRCTVCSHPKTKEIEQKIVQGKANTQIADTYGLDHQSVRYHRMNHLPEKLVKSVQKKEEKHAENMLDGINDLLDRTKSILDQAEEKDQKSLALKAIREARSTYELLSKIAVKLEEYRRADEKKQEGQARQQIEEGLQALSDKELEAYIQLQAKIYQADPSSQLSPEARMVVDAVTENNYISPSAENSDKEGSSRPNSPRNGEGQPKNSQITRSDSDSDLELDDLDDLDLSLDDSRIPSEDDDPDWLRKERRRKRRYH